MNVKKFMVWAKSHLKLKKFDFQKPDKHCEFHCLSKGSTQLEISFEQPRLQGVYSYKYIHAYKYKYTQDMIFVDVIWLKGKINGCCKTGQKVNLLAAFLIICKKQDVYSLQNYVVN